MALRQAILAHKVDPYANCHTLNPKLRTFSFLVHRFRSDKKWKTTYKDLNLLELLGEILPLQGPVTQSEEDYYQYLVQKHSGSSYSNEVWRFERKDREISDICQAMVEIGPDFVEPIAKVSLKRISRLLTAGTN